MKLSRKKMSNVKCQMSNVKCGQSLLEVVVAVGIVAALAVALVTTSLITQKTSKSSAANTQASKLVQEKIEQMRVYRDRKGFDELPTVDGNCFFLDSGESDPKDWKLKDCFAAGLPSTGEEIVRDNITFARRITVTSQPPNKKKIVVTVSWIDSAGLQTVSNTTILTDLAEFAK